MGNKTFLIIGLLILLVSIPLALILLTKPAVFNLRASAQSLPNDITITAVTDQSASISWQTASPTQASLKYGLNPHNLSLVSVENQTGTSHQLLLEGLLPDSDYFFALQIGHQTYTDPTYKFHTQPRPTASACSNESQLKASLGQEDSPCDLNTDGIVNSIDLFLIRQNRQN
jgi:hypothetical protein